MSEQQNAPLALALIVADHITRDLGTGKLSVHGIFNAIGALSFPWTHPSIMVYGALTDGRLGKTPIMLRLVDAEEERPPVVEAPGEVDFPDPFAIVEFVLALNGVVFPEAGEYRLQLHGAGTPLLERRILVVPVPTPQDPPDSPQTGE
ncbi:MAG: hypothetical protein HYS12_02480 [Planctomycetes bacterium]|nr:hypothetical protein [Planctomycetota bacterium]